MKLCLLFMLLTGADAVALYWVPNELLFALLLVFVIGMGITLPSTEDPEGFQG